MSYEIAFNGPDADARALAEMEAYLGPKIWKTITKAAIDLEEGKAEDLTFGTLSFGINMAGVSGFPVHAFGRAYCPKVYAAWQAEPEPEE